MADKQDGQSGRDRTLNGWREIASYFGRTQSTVKRWAAERGMPVHRLAGESARRGLPVFAHVHELAAWRQGSSPDVDAESDARPNSVIDSVSAISDDAAPSAEEGVVAAAEPVPVDEHHDERAAAPSRPLYKQPLVVALVLILCLALVGAVTLALQPSATPPPAAERVVPEEARELYLRGTYLWNRRNPEGIAGAIETLERAIDIHPDYAEAHAGLAMTYNLARQYSGMSGFEAYPKAEEHARRAVALDPTLGFAHSVLAFVEFHWLWQVEAGLERFEQALALDPDSSNTLMWYASSLLHADRADEALPLLSRAQELDPDSSAVFNMKAIALFLNGQVDDAEDVLREIMGRDPSYVWVYPSMYYVQLSRGDYAGYLANYARLGEMIGVPRYADAARAGAAALATGGVEAMADAMVAVETAYYERGEALAWDVARHHAIAGDVAEAVRWLRISLDRHEERLIGLYVDAAFLPVRNHPDFMALAADVGLPPLAASGVDG